MRRTPEPELMESEAQAVSYAQADFSESNQIFISNLLQQASINSETKILDIGCGYTAHKNATVICDIQDLSKIYKEDRIVIHISK